VRKHRRLLCFVTQLTYCPSGASTHSRSSHREQWLTAKVVDSQAVSNRSLESDKTLVVIQTDDFTYTVSDDKVKGNGSLIGAAVAHAANHNHDCRFIVGDPIRYQPDKKTMQVIDADGKECKMEIVRQERVQR
jgi:hypothetical protein